MPTSPIYRVRTEWTGLPGGPGLSTTYVNPGASGASGATECVGAFWASIDIRIATPADWNVQVDCELIDPSTGNIIQVDPGTAEGGTGAAPGDQLSVGTQGLLNLRTGVYPGTKEMRGKLYIPAPTVDSATDGLPSSVWKTAVGQAWDAAVNASDAEIVVYSPTYLQWQPVSATVNSTYFARIRSRQR